MRLNVFHEAKDSLKHNDPEIQDVLEKFKKELESVGMAQKPYENRDNYPFRDDDENQAMAYFTDGILDFAILVETEDRSEFKLFIGFSLLAKYSVTGEDVPLATVSLKGLDLSNTLSILNDALVQVKKLENIFDWVLDVTAKYRGIKFKIVRSGLSTGGNSELRFPSSLAAVGGEYNFYAKGDDKKEQVY